MCKKCCDFNYHTKHKRNIFTEESNYLPLGIMEVLGLILIGFLGGCALYFIVTGCL